LGLLKSVTFKVYLLPLGNQNYLSNWLENHDVWYGRNVYYPSLLLLPTFPWMKNGCDYFDPSKFNSVYDRRGKKVSDSKNSVYQLLKYKAPKGFLTPHRIYRTLLNNYLLDACQANPVNVFTVQCLTHEISTERGGAVDKSSRIKDYIGLCFCQRIEIGTHVEAMFHKRELRLDDNITVEEVVKSKSFKDPKTPLAVSYSPMDTTMTASATVVAEPSKFYQSIMIKNVSKFGDKAPLASPCQGWLEVALIDDVVAKKKKKNRDCDQAQSVHVENVTIDSNGPMKFPILMDGELYGPFHKIIIECKNRLQFDLMTFKRH